MQHKNQIYRLIHTIFEKRIFLLSIWALAALCFAAGTDNSFIKARAFWIGEDPAATPDVHWKHYQGLLTQGYGSQPLWIKLQVKPIPDEPANLPIELNIRPGYLDQINLYDPVYGQSNHPTVGDQFGWSNNARPTLSYNFTIPNGSAPRDIYLRIKTASTRLVEITALSPTEVTAWDRNILTQSNLIMFALIFFLFWAIYNWFTHKDELTASFVLLQIGSVFYGFFVLGFARLYLSDNFSPILLDQLTRLSVVGYTFINIWFYKTLLSGYQLYRWSYQCLRILMVSILPVIVTYAMDMPWLSFQINSTIAFVACIAVGSISLWGIDWHKQNTNPSLLSKHLLIGYFFALVLINLIHSSAILNLGWASLLSGYGSTLNGVLTGLLLTIILHVRSKNLDYLKEQRITTERLRAEAEQKERERQSAFLDMLAHELKTPLSVVALAIDTEAPSKKLSQLAHKAVTSMKDVISKCVQSSKLTEGQVVTHLQEINLGELLTQLVDQHAESQRLCLNVQHSIKTMADLELLIVVVNNLLDNAIKYGKKHSSIEIALVLEDSQSIYINVINEVGHAGRPDDLKLFQKYYRSPTAQYETGSGLGLYLSRMLMQIQNGDLKYMSMNDRVCFQIHLPKTI